MKEKKSLKELKPKKLNTFESLVKAPLKLVDKKQQSKTKEIMHQQYSSKLKKRNQQASSPVLYSDQSEGGE